MTRDDALAGLREARADSDDIDRIRARAYRRRTVATTEAVRAGATPSDLAHALLVSYPVAKKMHEAHMREIYREGRAA